MGVLGNSKTGLLSEGCHSYIRQNWGTAKKTGIAKFVRAEKKHFTLVYDEKGYPYVSAASPPSSHAASGDSAPRQKQAPQQKQAPRAHVQQVATAWPRRDAYRYRQRRSWPLPCSRGSKPPMVLLPFKYVLPGHDMPSGLRGATPAERDVWLRRRVGAAAEGPVEPTAGNYVALFTGLLFLEELQMKRDIRSYDMNDVVLETHKARPSLLNIQVPGLAEKRPSVLRGDHITVMTDAAPDRVHQGYVHFVNLDSVSVHFAPSMVPCCGTVSLYQHHVRFSYTRTPLRKQHQALHLCNAWPVLELLALPGGRKVRPKGSIKYNVVDSAEVAAEVVGNCLAPAPELFVDCEGESLSRRGTLHLLQIGDGDQIFLFDVQALGRDGVLRSGLAELLEAPYPKKIMWDCREDSDALFHQFGIRLDGVVDLQLLEVMSRTGGEAAVACQSEPLRIRGLKSLMDTAGDSACSGADISLLIAQRPLPGMVLDYAARDIESLSAAARKLGLASLDPRGRINLEQASVRYCSTLCDLPARNFDHYEKSRAPWAGPYLPEGVLECVSSAVPCRRCRRRVAAAEGEPCRACGAIDASRPPPAEHSAGAVCYPSSRRSNWRQPPLNERQRAAVEKVGAMKRGELRVIFGPPGTGKTVTMVSAVQRVLDAPHARVLCACPSNTAADVIAERLSTLFDETELYRCYAQSRNPRECPAPLERYTTPNMTSGYTIHEVSKLASFRVIVATCNAAFYLYSLGLPRHHFTHIFVDEAGQATEPDCIVPISVSPDAALVLAGDPRQLGPVVRSPLALRHGLGRSTLERLIADARHAPAVTQLTETYRAHEAITALYSDTFYDATLVPRAPADVTARFLGWELLPQPGVPMLFWHVEGEERRDADSPSWYNADEIDVVKKVLESLLHDNAVRVREEEIGVITPYHKQKKKLEGHFHHFQRFGGVVVRTVEGFQGQERPVIIVTTVRSRPENILHDRQFQLGFVEHPRRTNVAVSRAQGLLVVVGNMKLLAIDPNWNTIIQHARRLGCVTGLPPDVRLETGRVGVITAPGPLRTSAGEEIIAGRGSAQVQAGDTVQVIGSNSTGLRIRMASGAVGYVPAGLVGFSASGDAAAEENVDAPWRDYW
eukprot:TRINITY_DN713_c0_g3_i1.p1 TRINITY_DN713_c0_g3~~TRINITY_DN713_c0_g3_i1.p1  ORF type:complete len:1121 (+),score=344.73 TRINITY_DN713_c0_g3_i1:472-3834(+)